MMFPKPKYRKQKKAKNNAVPTLNDLCEVCGKQYAHLHEVFYGNGYRQLSIKYGMQIRLCYYHHQDSKAGIHFNRKFDLEVSKRYRDIFISKNSEKLFNEVFGDNYNVKLVKYERVLQIA